MKPINPWPLIAMLVLVLFLYPLAQRLSGMNEVDEGHHRQGLGVATRKCAGARAAATMPC